MEKLGLNEIREKFLSFMESKGHLRLDSFSLVPQNDKSLLLINSGMAPLKPYFKGLEVPPRNRITTCQKCIRTGDIENIGKTDRHGTFFEMLGNFSFGDYFKEEAISWSWEFLTKVMEIPEDRLYPSVYEEDDEAFEIWNKKIGVAKERIFKFGKADNFWEHGTGPCGPCSEIYYDRGEKYGCGKPDCTVGCDCDRYIEVWNNVFTQFDAKEDGTYEELEQKNIDTGMGLERLATVMQDTTSIFDVDTIKAVREKVCEIAGVTYGKNHKTDVSIRIITDHVRSATFMTADGVMFSNEGRGYVLRRLLRRASRHGMLLGIDGMFLNKVVEVVINSSKNAYKELEEKKDFIMKAIESEEQKFNGTIKNGMDLLDADIERLKSENKTQLSGSDAFKLYDTYGFPIELTEEILEDNGMTLNMDEFKEEMQKQKERARNARTTTNYMGRDLGVYDNLDESVKTEFKGYSMLETNSKVLAITNDTEIVEEANEGDQITIFLDITPFYATSGGQHGDTGIIETSNGKINIYETKKVAGTKWAHLGEVVEGSVKVGEEVIAKVDKELRGMTARNHTATHLLQKALRTVLGTHVEQAGSDVSSDRLRFDFTHFKAITPEELKEIEKIVNESIMAGYDVEVKEMPIEEAKKIGAMALFGEKYGDTVRVVNAGNYSIEFCGGTHIDNTGKIGLLKITSESSVASGVRRIEAVTGKHALEYYNNALTILEESAKSLKCKTNEVVQKISNMQNKEKELLREIEKAKSSNINGELDEIIESNH